MNDETLCKNQNKRQTQWQPPLNGDLQDNNWRALTNNFKLGRLQGNTAFLSPCSDNNEDQGETNFTLQGNSAANSISHPAATVDTHYRPVDGIIMDGENCSDNNEDEQSINYNADCNTANFQGNTADITMMGEGGLICSHDKQDTYTTTSMLNCWYVDSRQCCSQDRIVALVGRQQHLSRNHATTNGVDETTTNSGGSSGNNGKQGNANCGINKSGNTIGGGGSHTNVGDRSCGVGGNGDGVLGGGGKERGNVKNKSAIQNIKIQVVSTEEKVEEEDLVGNSENLLGLLDTPASGPETPQKRKDAEMGATPEEEVDVDMVLIAWDQEENLPKGFTVAHLLICFSLVVLAFFFVCLFVCVFLYIKFWKPCVHFLNFYFSN
jgi:hypothetical protein